MSTKSRTLAASKVAEIASRIKREILVGNIAPGAELFEGVLAAAHGCSIASIRRVLVNIEHEGLLSRNPRKGAIVANFTRREVTERNEVRVPLEILACQRAAYRLSDGDYLHLEGLVEGMAVDPDADRQFHQFIWERAEQQELVRALKNIVSPLFTFVPLTRVVLANLTERIEAHHELLRAIRTRNSELIANGVGLHAERAYSHFRSSKWPDFRAMYEAALLRPGASVSLPPGGGTTS